MAMYDVKPVVAMDAAGRWECRKTAEDAVDALMDETWGEYLTQEEEDARRIIAVKVWHGQMEAPIAAEATLTDVPRSEDRIVINLEVDDDEGENEEDDEEEEAA